MQVSGGICGNMPELKWMFNPCMSAEVLIEITNDGTLSYAPH